MDTQVHSWCGLCPAAMAVAQQDRAFQAAGISSLAGTASSHGDASKLLLCAISWWLMSSLRELTSQNGDPSAKSLFKVFLCGSVVKAVHFFHWFAWKLLSSKSAHLEKTLAIKQACARHTFRKIHHTTCGRQINVCRPITLPLPLLPHKLHYFSITVITNYHQLQM